MVRQKRGSREDLTIRVSVSFPETQYRELERIASNQRVSLAWVVREAMGQYITTRWPLLQEDKESK